MSQNPPLPPPQRYQLIKEHIAHKTQDDIALLCGVERRTIVRDIRHLKDTGDWWDFLEHALLHYSRKDTVSDESKFKEYAKLYGKQFITEHKTTSTDIHGEIVIKGWHLGESSTDDTG